MIDDHGVPEVEKDDEHIKSLEKNLSGVQEEAERFRGENLLILSILYYHSMIKLPNIIIMLISFLGYAMLPSSFSPALLLVNPPLLIILLFFFFFLSAELRKVTNTIKPDKKVHVSRLLRIRISSKFTI